MNTFTINEYIPFIVMKGNLQMSKTCNIKNPHASRIINEIKNDYVFDGSASEDIVNCSDAYNE
jgi:hypothetical protein